MKKIFSIIILSLILTSFVGGCKFSDWSINEDSTGKTKLEQSVNTIGEGMQNYGQGTVVGLAGTLLLTIGGLVTFVRKTITEKNLNTAIITGVQEYSTLLKNGIKDNVEKPEVKKIIAKVAMGKKVSDKLNTRVAKVTGDPKTGV